MGEKYLTIKISLTQLNEVKPEKVEKARFRSRIEQSPLGASRGPGCDFNLDAGDWETIRQFTLKMQDGNSLKRGDVEEFGKKFFKLIFTGEVWAKYNQCLGRLSDGMKLRLAIAVLSEHLVKIPWEYLHDGNGFLLKSQHMIVRIIDELAERKAPFSPIRRLLVSIANPQSEIFSSFDAQTHEKTITEKLDKTTIDYEILNPCTRSKLEDAIRGGNYDAFYFAGHGDFTADKEGHLILEDDNKNIDPLDATDLAEWLSNPDNNDSINRVRFAYLNSCSTAKNLSANPFAGVAQRLMRDGNVDAVVAMQTKVDQTSAFDMAADFFDEMHRGKSPEKALALARNSGGDNHSWGVPVIYTYLSGPEDFDKNRLAYFLSAEIGKSSFGLFLPTFRFGILTEEANPSPKLKLPPDFYRDKDNASYFYKGETLSVRDTESGLDVIRLLTRIVPSDEIELWRSNDQAEAQCSHWFIFGSRSNKVVQSVLGIEDYAPRFAFDYKSEPGKWIVRDKKLTKNYSINEPHQSTGGEYDQNDDIGVIEKIISDNPKQVFFLLSGLGDRATRGCGWYLYQNWEELMKEFGNSRFGIALKFRGGFGFSQARRLDIE